jgi:uncharacterized protein (TIGR03083 family)
MVSDRVLDARAQALGDAWGWWAATLQPLTPDDWTRPTRLEGWDVHALAAHHAQFVTGLDFLAANPLDGPAAVPSAAAMLNRFNAPGGVAHELAGAVAELARQQAATNPPAVIVERFATGGPKAIAAVRACGPIVVDYFGNGAFPIAEALSIGIVEAVVHGLDLARAVSREPDLPAVALDHTVAVLAQMPDPVTFIEAATGRRTDAVFPILR